jgi:hypothetical protein
MANRRRSFRANDGKQHTDYSWDRPHGRTIHRSHNGPINDKPPTIKQVAGGLRIKGCSASRSCKLGSLFHTISGQWQGRQKYNLTRVALQESVRRCRHAGQSQAVQTDPTARQVSAYTDLTSIAGSEGGCVARIKMGAMKPDLTDETTDRRQSRDPKYPRVSLSSLSPSTSR